MHYFSVNSTGGNNYNNDGAKAADSIAIGKDSTIADLAASSIVLGNNTTITTSARANNIAIGSSANIQGGQDSIAFGTGATIGSNVQNSAVAIGNASKVEAAQGGVAIGNGSTVNSSANDGAIAIGQKSNVSGISSIALGNNASVTGAQQGSIAIGNNTNVTSTGERTVAVGSDTNVTVGNAVAMGDNVNISGQYSVAVGSSSNISNSAVSAVAIGHGSNVSKNYGIAIGNGSSVSGDGLNGTALGQGSSVTAQNAVAIGSGSVADRQAWDQAGYTPYIPSTASSAQRTAIEATKAANGGAVSVGSSTIKRQIINVAAGSADTDAVNVAQLKAAVSEASSAATWNILEGTTKKDEVGSNDNVSFANGNGTTANVSFNSATNTSTVTYSVNQSGLTVAADGTVSAVQNGNNFATAEQVAKAINDSEKTTTVKGLGNVTVTGTTTGTVTNYNVSLSESANNSLAKADTALQSWTAQVGGQDAKTLTKDNNKLNFVNGKNINITNENGDIRVSTADSVTFTDVKTDTLNIGDKVTINNTGINAGNTKITNVTAGTADTDAVNVKQLNDTVVANKVVVQAGKNTTVTPSNDGKLYTVDAWDTQVEAGDGLTLSDGAYKNDAEQKRGYKLDLSQTTKDNIQKGVDANTTVTTKGITFNGNSGSTGAKMLGSELSITATGKGGAVANTTATDAGVVVNVDTTALETNISKNAENITKNAANITNNANNITKNAENIAKNASNITNNTNAINALKTNTIKLGGDDSSVTNAQQLGQEGGIQFNIVGNDQIAASASGNQVALSIKDGSIGTTQLANQAVTGDKVANKTLDKAQIKTGNVTSGTPNLLTVVNGTDRLVGTDDLVLSVNTENLASATNISYKANGDAAKAVSLATGFNFTNGTNTVASVNDNGVVSFDLNQATKDDIKKGVDANTTVTTKGITFNGNSGSTGAKMLGSELSITATGKGGAVANTTATDAGVVVNVDTTALETNISKNAENITKNANNITKNAENITKNAAEIAKGIKFGNGTNANQYQLGDTLNVTSGNANIISETIAGGVKLTLADSINLSRVNAGGTILNGSGLTAGNVKVSSGGIDAGNTKITNVSAGTADTDAVNVKQLKQQSAAAKTEVKAGTNVASVDAKVGENGQTVYTVNANGTAVKAGDGLSVSSSLDKDKNVTTYTVALNDETKRQLAKEESVVAGSKNVTVTADKKNATGGKEFVVDIAKDLDLSKDGSLTIGNTVVNNDGVKIGDTVVNKDGVKVGDVSITAEGINAGNKTVSNVADGVKDTDAVNVRQLKEIAKTASKGWNLSVNNGKNSGNVAPGDSVDLRSADNNVVVSKEGNNVSFALNNELSIGGKNGKDGSLGVKGADGKDGVVANGDGTLVINGKNGVDGKAGANATLTVAEGQKTLDETGANSTRIVYTDGKNTTQEVATMKDGLRFAGNQGAILNKKLNETLSIEGGLDNQQAASSKNVRVDSEDGKLIVKLAENAQFTSVTTGKTSMSDAGIQAGNVKIDANTGKISGVTAGTADNDAVNVKQLKASKTELVDGSGTKVVANTGNNGQTVYKVNVEGDLTKISSISQGNTKISLKEGEVNMNGSRITSVADGVKPNDAVNVSQLNRGLAQINNNINKVDKDLRGGIAGALASAGLYQATLPGKSMVSAGVGTYKGENAVALGYSRLSDSGKLGVKFSVNSNSRGDRGAAASVGYQW